jgi:hypothetical protein
MIPRLIRREVQAVEFGSLRECLLDRVVRTADLDPMSANRLRRDTNERLDYVVFGQSVDFACVSESNLVSRHETIPLVITVILLSLIPSPEAQFPILLWIFNVADAKQFCIKSTMSKGLARRSVDTSREVSIPGVLA